MFPIIAQGSVADALEALRGSGAVVIRGPGRTVDGFVSFTDELMEADPYHSVATRERDAAGAKGTNVATVNKGTGAMSLHRESSFLPTQPDIVALYCEQAPAEGGQTTLCDGVELLAALPDGVRSFLAEETLVWRFVLPIERWSVMFGTDSLEQVTRRIKELMERFGSSATYEFTFTEDDELDGTYRAPFVSPTFWDGVSAFSNSLMYWYNNQGPFIAKRLHHVTLSNGERIPEDVIKTVEECAEKLLVETAWNQGDIVLVDNSRVMHGRRAIVDPQRKVLVRLGRYRSDAAHERRSV